MIETIIDNLLGSDSLLDLCVISFVSFLGSFSKTYLSVMRDPYKQKSLSQRFLEIILSTITATILIFTFSTKIEQDYSLRGVVLASYIAGLVGYELLNRFSSIKGIMSLISSGLKIYEIYSGLNRGNNETSPNNKTSEPPSETNDTTNSNSSTNSTSKYKYEKEKKKYRWKTDREIESDKNEEKSRR